MPPLAVAPPTRTSGDIRQGALAAVVAAVMFGVLSRLFGVGDSFAVVFDRYHSLFMPARFAFAIWLVIHAAFITYAIVIRRSSRLAVAGHDQQAKLLIAASILGPAWMIAFKFDLISLGMLLMIAMLVVAIAMFLDAQDLCRRERLSPVWTVPFSLYLGWIGVSTLINIGVWLVAVGWRGGGVGETQLAVAMIVVSAMLGIGVGFRFADAVVPMVVAWALFGVWSGQREADLAVSMTAFVAGSACAIGAVFSLIRSVVQARNEHAPRHIALTGT